MVLSLVGYTTGGGEAPQFMEPVFSDGEKQFAQVCNDDQIVGFVQINEELDLLEHVGGATYEVGTPKIYAVLDSGQRVISGDRTYVTRYLSQNKDSYIDKPFFYASVLEFCGLSAPELEFVNHRSELIEIAALSNSIRRFFVHERQALLNSNDALPADSALYWLQHSRNTGWENWLKASSLSGKEKGFPTLWLEFASNDSPRLAEQSRWGGIDEVVERVSSRKSVTSWRYLYFVFKAAEEYLSEASIEGERLNPRETKASNELALSRIERNASVRLKKYRRRLVSAYKSKISENVVKQRTSKTEISMMVLFFKLSLKIYKDEILESDEAKIRISEVSQEIIDMTADNSDR